MVVSLLCLVRIGAGHLVALMLMSGAQFSFLEALVDLGGIFATLCSWSGLTSLAFPDYEECCNCSGNKYYNADRDAYCDTNGA